MPRWRRQDLLSKSWFQLRITLYYLFVLLGGAAALSWYLYRTSSVVLRQEMFGGHSMAATPWQLLRDHILKSNVLATAGVIVAAVAVTFLITRAIARGAAGLSENLKRTRAGGKPRNWKEPYGIYEFRHLQRQLAEACDSHGRRVAELQLMSRLIAEKADSVLEVIEQDGIDTGQRALRDLHVQCEKLKNAVETFTLEEP